MINKVNKMKAKFFSVAVKSDEKPQSKSKASKESLKAKKLETKFSPAKGKSIQLTFGSSVD